MLAEEFVEELKKIPIEIETLKAQGVSGNYIQNLMQSYQLKKKAKSIYSGNPVLELVENYDASHLGIGMINFYETIEEEEDYVFFGKFEIDELAIHKNLGTVVMLESESEQVIYKCAANGSNFLDAIVVAAAFLEKRANDDSLYENQKLTCQIAEECAEIAGGKECQDFYKMMLGCEE